MANLVNITPAKHQHVSTATANMLTDVVGHHIFRMSSEGPYTGPYCSAFKDTLDRCLGCVKLRETRRKNVHVEKQQYRISVAHHSCST